MLPLREAVFLPERQYLAHLRQLAQLSFCLLAGKMETPAFSLALISFPAFRPQADLLFLEDKTLRLLPRLQEACVLTAVHGSITFFDIPLEQLLDLLPDIAPQQQALFQVLPLPGCRQHMLRKQTGNIPYSALLHLFLWNTATKLPCIRRMNS